jgi:hypothetical protein
MLNVLDSQLRYLVKFQQRYQMRRRNSRGEDLCRGVASAVYEPVGSFVHKAPAMPGAGPNGSAVAWQHLNLLGEYDFSDEKLRDSIGIRPPKLVD